MKLFATSDIHIGLKFTGYADVQDALIEARFAALERMVDLANREQCDLFVIAGDLFERQGVPRRDVLRVRHILDAFEGALVAVLPGNHDYLASGDAALWNGFEESGAGTVLVLREPVPYPLKQRYDIDACLYPGPCVSKHSADNAIGWIRDSEKDAGLSFHIGVAHGSLEGVSPDFDGSFYPMTDGDLAVEGIDCWVLGHTHVPRHEGAVYIAGTPEPDGFDCTHEGGAWIVEMKNGTHLGHHRVATGSYRFETAAEQAGSVDDLERIGAAFSSRAYRNCLLKLTLSGSLPREDYERIGTLRRQVSDSVFHLHSFVNDVREEISREDIDREFTEGSFAHRLLTRLSEREEDSRALQTAYHLIGQVRQ